MVREFTLHHPTEDDWAEVRELRVRMVTDTPIAFLESREQALARTEQQWRDRIREQAEAGSFRVVAVSPTGRWVGTMACFLTDGSPGYVIDRRPGPRRANLVGVFVDPEWRGDAGVADALLHAVVDWVREQGLVELYLHVGDINARARRYYEKRGFHETGVVDATAEQPGMGEVEMVATLPVGSTV
jgi:GNAT superfamily N-acetyltransferase